MFGEELKAQDSNFVHYFLLNIPFTYFTKCHAAYQNFFSRYLLDHLLYRLQFVEAWFGHCITSVRYIVISPKDEYLWDWP